MFNPSKYFLPKIILPDALAPVTAGSRNEHMGLIRRVLCLVLLLCLAIRPAQANVITLTQADVGGTGATSSYSYTSMTQTYTLSGAGAGIAAYADACSTAFMQTSGNIEIIAQVSSQSDISGNDFAGVMIRGSLATGAPMACMGVEPSTGAHFIDRYFSGGYASDTTGPAVTAPTWVRLTYNASSNYVEGYQSTDGLNWNLVGAYYSELPTTFYVGFAVSSASYGNLSTATFNNVSFLANVPQNSGAMQPALWLRSDVGVTASSGQVSQWNDQSSAGNNAVQSTNADQPTVTAGAVNGVAALTFNGSSQYMSLSPGLYFGSSGITAYVVVNPTAASSSARVFDFGDGASNNNFTMQQASSNGAAVYLHNYSTGSSISASSALTLNEYQSLSTFIGTSGSSSPASLYTNGSLDTSGTLNNPGYTYRSYNYIGTTYGTSSDFFEGSIAEILIFPQTLTALQKISVDAYLYGKYGVGSEPVLPPVVITPSTGVVTGQTNNLTMTDVPGALIYYTSDGSEPDPATSPLYTGALTATNATYNAIAVMPFATTSTMATAVLKIDPSAAPVPTAGLQQWLLADYQVTANDSNQVSQWFDMSGNGNTYSQATTDNQPILTSNFLQGIPAVVFDGSASYLQAPSGLANFSTGLSIFAVTTPSAFSANARTLDCGTGSADENFILRQDSGADGGIGFDTYNGTSGSSVTAPSASLIINRGQLVEAFLNTTPTGSICLNGISLNSGSMNALNNITRTGNYIGTNNGATSNFLPGAISEMLVYSGVLTGAQINGVEQYLLEKYQLLPTLPAPVFSPPSDTTFPTDSQVAIIAPAECEIRYTVDGSTPGPDSTLYVGPIMDNVSSLTVKAITLQNGYPNSAVQTATYTVTSP